MMKEQIDNLIKKARKENSSSLLIYTLIKSELVNNEHSKHPLSDIDVLRKMLKGEIKRGDRLSVCFKDDELIFAHK